MQYIVTTGIERRLLFPYIYLEHFLGLALHITLSYQSDLSLNHCNSYKMIQRKKNNLESLLSKPRKETFNDAHL